jgi:hypothetical protein
MLISSRMKDSCSEEGVTVYARAIAQARSQLKNLPNDAGTDALLAKVSQLETLWTLIQKALLGVSEHIRSLNAFYDALAVLREYLNSARMTLRILEQETDSLHFSREASLDGVMVVRSVLRIFSRDLDDLVFGLPPESSRRKQPRPLALDTQASSRESSIGDDRRPGSSDLERPVGQS